MKPLLLLLAFLLAVPAFAQQPDARAYLDPETGLELSAEDQARLDAFLANRPRTVVAARPADSPRRTPQPPTYDRGAVVFTVDSAYDDDPDTDGDGVCSGPSYGECQLRSAINEANAQPDNQPVRIEFNITTGPTGSEVAPGVWRITLDFADDSDGFADPLTFLSQPNLTIDGLTQPGASCGDLVGGVKHDLRVILDGSNTVFGDGLLSLMSGFTVRGLVVQNFPIYGIGDDSSFDALVECSYVGTDHTGEIALGNRRGIDVDGSVRNSLVSGNALTGIELDQFDIGAPTPVIENNLVGTDADGNEPLGNGSDGLVLRDLVEVSPIVRGNVISANGSSGILMGSAFFGSPVSNTSLYGNMIGLSRTGQSLGLGNGTNGIEMSNGAFDNDIGVPGEAPNYISDNGGSSFSGIRVEGTGTDGNRIRNNIVGLDVSGNAAPNGFCGVIATDDGGVGSPSGTIIGGPAANARNTIAGNPIDGICLRNDIDSHVEGNTVGLNAAGAARPNGGGISLVQSTGAVVRGNVVSGNTGYGILATVVLPGALIEDNIVGLANNGITPSGNGTNGIEVFASDGVTVRGNTTSSNGAHGIRLTAGSSGGTVADNHIGTRLDGTDNRGNGGDGFQALGADDLTLSGNVISDNGGSGIFLDVGTDDVVIRDNRIGTRDDGSGDLGNGSHGIHCLDATDVRIGGTASGDRNKIARNGGDGVFLADDCTRVAVLRNEIVNNGGLGIDLAPNGVNPNDPGDIDGGPNQGTNFPVITSATNDGTDAVVTVSLDARPNQQYRIELFRTGAADASGYGEGSTFIADRSPTTDGSGALTTTFTRPASDFQVGKWASATATPVNGSTFTGFTGTSEFSRAVEVEDASGPPLTVTITPTSSVVLERGDRAFFDITFDVGATGPSSFEFWTEAVLPGGGVRTPLIGPNTVNVTPPAVVTLSFSQQVPNVAPFGSYTYRVKAGSFPSSVEDQDSFAAQVVPGRRADAPADWQAFDAEGTLLGGPRVYDFRTATEESAAASSEALPTEATLAGAYPNPFSRSATVGFALPSSQRVTLTVYDVLGREVARLVDGEVEAGRHEAVLDGASLPSGVYLVRLATGGTVQTQRLTLLR